MRPLLNAHLPSCRLTDSPSSSFSYLATPGSRYANAATSCTPRSPLVRALCRRAQRSSDGGQRSCDLEYGAVLLPGEPLKSAWRPRPVLADPTHGPPPASPSPRPAATPTAASAWLACRFPPHLAGPGDKAGRVRRPPASALQHFRRLKPPDGDRSNVVVGQLGNTPVRGVTALRHFATRRRLHTLLGCPQPS